jgi:PadR family transcriptional regulator PadR
MSVSTEMMKGTVVPITLKLLSEREMYGYEIIKEVNARTNQVLEWKEATLYPWLHRLEQDGLIHSEWQEHPGTRRRKYYALTRKGAASLAQKTHEWTELSGAVTAILVPMATA